MLNLEKVLEIDKMGRNNYVLDLNYEQVEDGYEFGEYYGALCGGKTEGLLEEESQESLFMLSGISIIKDTVDTYTLLQDGKVYTVRKVFGKEGVSVVSEHLDFTNLRRV